MNKQRSRLFLVAVAVHDRTLHSLEAALPNPNQSKLTVWMVTTTTTAIENPPWLIGSAVVFEGRRYKRQTHPVSRSLTDLSPLATVLIVTTRPRRDRTRL